VSGRLPAEPVKRTEAQVIRGRQILPDFAHKVAQCFEDLKSEASASSALTDLVNGVDQRPAEAGSVNARVAGLG